ncbi:MAG: DUF1345 domain-containing protein [Actinobacteria bacterium]|nr:DUF1345 domain-containing protein [Actinomycetota bacterium]
MRALANSMVFRIGISIAAGVIVGVGVSFLRHPAVAVMAAWAGFATAFTVLTWFAVGRLDAAQTREHAQDNDPNDGMASSLVVIASLASVVGVGFLLAGESHKGQPASPLVAGVGVTAVVASWVAVHTVYVLRYARLYYASDVPTPINFHSTEDPDYQDFAYIAYTVGMTYQVSDPEFHEKRIRHIALRHAIVSYVLGAVILATTINLVVQLASG